MVGVSGDTPDAEEDQGFQRPNILLGVPQFLHVVVGGTAAGIFAGGTVRNHPLLFGMDPVDQTPKSLVVEVHIGQGGEQAFLHQLIICGAGSAAVCCSGQADQGPGQRVKAQRQRQFFRRHRPCRYSRCTQRSVRIESKTFEDPFGVLLISFFISFFHQW